MGDEYTGVTTMLTNAGLDTGDMLLHHSTRITDTETAGELTDRLAVMGAELLVETIRRMEAGDCMPIPQNEAESSYEPMLTKEMAQIDWTLSAKELDRFVRAYNPWPTAYTQYGDMIMKIHMARPVDMQGTPGEILVSDGKKGLVVACGEGALEIITLQAPNAKAMDAKAYLRGKPIPQGARFGHE